MYMLRQVKKMDDGNLLVTGSYSVQELYDDDVIVKDNGKIHMDPNPVNQDWKAVFVATGQNKWSTRFRGFTLSDGKKIEGKLPYGDHQEFNVAFDPLDNTLSFTPLPAEKNHKVVNVWTKDDDRSGVEGTYRDYNHAPDQKSSLAAYGAPLVSRNVSI